MTARTLFTFWEPSGRLVPYLELCLETWRRVLSGYNLVVLDHTTLETYLGGSMYNPAQLKRLPLPLQKDAIMVAVLLERGGIFLDVDTLAVRDLAPLLRPLDRAELVMIGSHMAFAAARPGARLLARWQEAIQERLARLDQQDEGPIPWDTVGNRVLTEMVDGMVARLPGLARLRRRAAEDGRTPLGRLGAQLWARKWRLFHTFYHRQLARLPRDRLGYLPEALYYPTMKAEARYRRFWFEDGLPLGPVFEADPILIGLHNSWTPAWYQALAAPEVLAHDCLLSRTLRHLLAG